MQTAINAARYADSAHPRLQRYISARHPDRATAGRAVEALRRDPAVRYAELAPHVSGSAAAPVAKSSQRPALGVGAKDPEHLVQDHRVMLQIDAAWAWAGGWALVGVAESGLHVNHPDLRAVHGTRFVGGRSFRALSYGAGSPDANPSSLEREFSRNVDERAIAPFQGVSDPAWLQPALVRSLYTPG